MNKLLLPLLLLCISCCTTQTAKPAPEAKVGDTRKPGAPFSIDAKVGAASVSVTLKFEADGKDVRVGAWGVDGITVSESVPLRVFSAEAVRAGELKSVTIPFTGTRGHVVISGGGNFGGAEKERAHTIMIGDGSPSTGTVQTTDDGDVVKLP